MKVFPAIDMINGEVVRLLKGDYGKVTRYSLSVEEAAKGFHADGARYLHAVDLDGAKSGRPDNAESVAKIIKAAPLFVEIGGGIREEGQISRYLSSGAGRVILGTVAVTDFPFVVRMAEKYGEKIVVGVDAADGKVAISGWRNVTDIDSIEFCMKLAKAGVRTVIYTDISKDGALAGTNLDIYKKLRDIEGLKITASGGITFLDEIGALKEIGVDAVILGRALYEGRLNLREAISVAGPQE
ncbi:MAG: 1-(5-phosphoribosyl)-5-[(5-phosphoribosylamino)methylideneamino]imidazole-4-carboxamide isomerase [Clostridia bacterium]|nr:1-(5-phosphoribosyl)-5-[(5-phosphoribosylamino)methylideneamino]imidazole-4-carboxamide isomerase [Clostridia bacterium]